MLGLIAAANLISAEKGKSLLSILQKLKNNSDKKYAIHRAMATAMFIKRKNDNKALKKLFSTKSKLTHMATAYMYSLSFHKKLAPKYRRLAQYYERLFEDKMVQVMHKRFSQNIIRNLHIVVSLLKKYPKEKMYQQYSYLLALYFCRNGQWRNALHLLNNTIITIRRKAPFCYGHHASLYGKILYFRGRRDIHLKRVRNWVKRELKN